MCAESKQPPDRSAEGAFPVERLLARDAAALKHRLLSGFSIFGALLVATEYLPGSGVWAVLVLVCGLAQLEFYSMLNLPGIPVFRILGTLCGALMVSVTFLMIGPEPGEMDAAYLWEHSVLACGLIAIFIRQFPQKKNDKPLTTIACTLLGILYVPYLFNYMTRLVFVWERANPGVRVSATGQDFLVYLVVVVKITDVAAYFAGKGLGRHRLFPRISPGKTWEGLGGGVLCALPSSVAFCALRGWRFGDVPVGPVDALILGFLLSMAAVLGDLFESLLKRASGAKDSGSMVPGMGGVLDLLDSLLFGAPVLYFYARLALM